MVFNIGIRPHELVRQKEIGPSAARLSCRDGRLETHGGVGAIQGIGCDDTPGGHYRHTTGLGGGVSVHTEYDGGGCTHVAKCILVTDGELTAGLIESAV